MNHLYYGDNLTRMQQMGKHSVDLIYLDPPFSSKQNYNLIYKNLTGMPVPDQAEAFCDTWEMDAQKEEIAKTMPILMREHGVEDYYVEFWRLWINALRHTQPHLLAYLIYMVQRLLHMKSILRPTGSIYLHCDPTASHYIKVMMDGIFGHQNFRNDIIWKRTTTHSDSKTWSRVSDNILFYTAGKTFTWNTPREEYSDEYIADKYRHDDGDGRLYQLDNMTSPNPRRNMMYEWKGFPFPEKGWRYQRETMTRLDKEGRIWYPQLKDGSLDITKRPRLKRYLDEMHGGVMGNVWTDISPVNSQAQERLGYPTQKPIPLLDRIIQTSSNKGDIVFDPFCGCGTTIYSAVKNGRKWIGCDVAILAIKMVREILTGDRFRLVEGVHFDVDGIPVSVEQAEELFKRDPFQFEHWLVERVGGFPTKKTGDKGVDGRMYFETKEGLKCMVLSVKGGKLRPTDVRDLRGVLVDQPDTEMAGFLSLQEPSKAMREAASLSSQYEYGGIKYDRMQFLTVNDILGDKREFHTPTKMVSRISTAQGSLAL
jgi:site-specific DNA-methyltransferase (adenine-specific)